MNDPQPRSADVDIPHTARSKEQRRHVEYALRDQVGQLKVRLGTDIEQLVIDRLVNDRKGRRDLSTIQVLGDRHHHPVLAASGQVLARVSDLSDDDRERASRIVGLDDVVVLSGDDPAKPSRKEFRPNYVTPMGVVVKALCGPEPAGDVPPQRIAKRRGAPVKVAVIDTGINAADRNDHWLEQLQTADNTDVLYPDPDPTKQDEDNILGLGAGHGTFVTGIIQQLAPGAIVKVYNPLKEDGLGTEADVAEAMIDACRWGADIINMSLGLETVDDEPPYALEAAVRAIAAGSQEVLIIAAAGNTGRNRKCWPGAFKDVTAVAGLTVDMTPAEWSTHGRWVDCSTLGEGVMSTYVTGTEDRMVDDPPDTFGKNPWALWSGTSFAAPQITGAVAQIAQHRGIGPRKALEQLLARGVDEPNYGTMVSLLTPGDLDSPVVFAPVG